MNISDFTCLNCSTEDNKSIKPVHRGRRYGTIDRKSEERTSRLDRHGPSVPPQIIKTPRYNRAFPTLQHNSYECDTQVNMNTSGRYRRAVDDVIKRYKEDLDENVVSSAQCGDFSVRMYSVESLAKDVSLGDRSTQRIRHHVSSIESIPPRVFSRASMVSSTPYRDITRTRETVRGKELGSPSQKIGTTDIVNVISQDGTTTRSNISTKHKKALINFEHASGARATLPSYGHKRIKLEHVECPTSFSLPGRLSETEDTLQVQAPISPGPYKAYLPEALYKKTSFHSQSPTDLTDMILPLTSSKRQVVKKLHTKNPKTRKDFAQLYTVSVQERRARYGTDNCDRSSTSSTEEFVKDTNRSEKLTYSKWLEETEELISTSNEALSREDYFKIVFFEKSLRRKLQLQEVLQAEGEVHISRKKDCCRQLFARVVLLLQSYFIYGHLF